ncbi:MAG: RNA-binding protein [Spirochaetaceae bacterium]|jgi:RNA recognition motif-containing protein|nr:RNA-binding protein [Spirochaetaceae bacterium]
MAKKLYVGNMNYATTEQSLCSLFSQFGEVVAANIVFDRYSGQAKGFGFVEMADEKQALEAIQALDGNEFEGRRIRVNEAIERERSRSQSSSSYSKQGYSYGGY